MVPQGGQRHTQTHTRGEGLLLPDATRWAETHTDTDTDTHTHVERGVLPGATRWAETDRYTHTHTQIHTHACTERGVLPGATRWASACPHTHPCPAIDPACSPTGSSREKKELQKILDRKRHNSISEAKTREKHKKEA